MNKSNTIQPPSALVIIAMLLVYGGLTLLSHLLLEDDSVYRHIGHFFPTYEVVSHEDGSWEAVQVGKPFVKPTEERLLGWDANHYKDISINLYNPEKSWEGNVAFFPAFPLLWRVSGLSAMGVCMLGWIMLCMGMAAVVAIFGKKISWRHCLLALCLPYLVIFMIPYSEALFFLFIAIGLYGLSKERYWIYFIGFMAGATVRAASGVLVVAWVVVDVLAWVNTKKSWKEFLIDVVKHTAPLLLGILAVAVYQYMHGAKSLLAFADAQRFWGKSLSLPEWPLSDWSVPGKSVTQPLLFIFFIPAILWLCQLFWKGLRSRHEIPFSASDYCRNLSLLYFVGNILLALLTQHGNMFSMARILTCTPFFVYLLFDVSTTRHPSRRLWLLLCFFGLSFIFYQPFPLNIENAGAILIYGVAALAFLYDRMPHWLTISVSLLLTIINTLWTAYLYNTFLTGGWIFT